MGEATYIIGVGITPFGKFLDRSVKDLTRSAVDAALADAGVERQDVRAAYFANASQAAIEGQYMIPGQIALRSMGFSGIPITNVENACASASTAFHAAQTYLKAGLGDVVLAVGAEKMHHLDKAKSFGVFEGAWDVHEAEENARGLLSLTGDFQPPPDARADANSRSIFVDVLAALAKFHMRTFGTTRRQIAAVASKNHGHSVFNPMSQYREPMSIEEVLAARAICWPLTLPMCAPISDGAAAAILCTESALKRYDRSRAVLIRACVLAGSGERAPEEFERQIGRRAALAAYEQAGVGPSEISVAEVHDASAFAEIQQSENLGFCAYGEGGNLVERGDTSLGGRIPINVSGGMVSKGHPIGATGLAQIHELVHQLRGEAGLRQVDGARLAIAENGGGFYRFEEASAVVTILGR